MPKTFCMLYVSTEHHYFQYGGDSAETFIQWSYTGFFAELLFSLATEPCITPLLGLNRSSIFSTKPFNFSARYNLPQASPLLFFNTLRSGLFQRHDWLCLHLMMKGPVLESVRRWASVGRDLRLIYGDGLRWPRHRTTTSAVIVRLAIHRIRYSVQS